MCGPGSGLAMDASHKGKKELKIGVSLYSESDTFVDSIVSSMQEQAAAYEAETGCPVTLNISRANGSQREQYDQVEQYVALGYDAVCVNLVDRTNASSMVDLAQSEEVPLVFSIGNLCGKISCVGKMCIM